MSNSTNKPRVGLLNSGGDCPGLNTVMDAVVKNLWPEYEVFGFIKGFEGLIDNEYMVLDPEKTSFYRWIGGTILRSVNKGRFPNEFAIRAGNKEGEKYILQVKETYDKLGLEGLIVLGGDGSLFMANHLQKYGINVIGVPKSIDNDLGCTDFTFGFQTAVQIGCEALDRLHTTAFSHERVMILELMGRHAGWISLYSGIAGGANVILLPEIPFSYEKVLDFLQRRKEAKNKKHAIIVVSEGAKDEEGKAIVRRDEGPNKNVLLGGVGEKLAEFINQSGDFEARNTVLGHVQRGGSPNAFDRVLSSQFGTFAADLFKQKMFGKMVVYQNNRMQVEEIDKAVHNPKFVDPSGQMVALAKASGIYFGD